MKCAWCQNTLVLHEIGDNSRVRDGLLVTKRLALLELSWFPRPVVISTHACWASTGDEVNSQLNWICWARKLKAYLSAPPPVSSSHSPGHGGTWVAQDVGLNFSFSSPSSLVPQPCEPQCTALTLFFPSLLFCPPLWLCVTSHITVLNGRKLTPPACISIQYKDLLLASCQEARGSRREVSISEAARISYRPDRTLASALPGVVARLVM